MGKQLDKSLRIQHLSYCTSIYTSLINSNLLFMSHLALYHYNHSKRGTLNKERDLKRIKTYGTYCFKLSYLQIKRKRPLQPNGSAPPAGELEKEEDHHAGPELQRTGR